AVTVALLLLSGVVVIIQLDKSSVAEPTDSPTRRTRPSATKAAVPQTGTKRTLPGGAITHYENRADAIVLTSYEVYDKGQEDWVDYARGSLRGTFSKYAANWETIISPDGNLVASRGRKYSSDDFDFIVITDRRTDERSTIKTVKEPLISSIRAWS